MKANVLLQEKRQSHSPLAFCITAGSREKTNGILVKEKNKNHVFQATVWKKQKVD